MNTYRLADSQSVIRAFVAGSTRVVASKLAAREVYRSALRAGCTKRSGRVLSGANNTYLFSSIAGSVVIERVSTPASWKGVAA